MEHKIVVLVDEDQEFDSIIKIKLESAGFEVHVADVPQAGLRMVEAIHPSLVLLDINMPGMNGMEFLAKLQEDTASKMIKVAFFSSMINPWSENGDIQKTVTGLGAVAFIDKAIDLDRLVEEVEELVQV